MQKKIVFKIEEIERKRITSTINLKTIIHLLLNIRNKIVGRITVIN